LQTNALSLPPARTTFLRVVLTAGLRRSARHSAANGESTQPVDRLPAVFSSASRLRSNSNFAWAAASAAKKRSSCAVTARPAAS
jgi:hypothetical protein